MKGKHVYVFKGQNTHSPEEPYFLDVFTVSLCRAGEWRGWILGYKRE
jgi:hypothetical protein